ncbi:molybdopterin molybdotransferase [Phycisphaerales bacterium]|nr:molybdopterin molybdotransferase [Phycisphaerales bacterium]
MGFRGQDFAFSSPDDAIAAMSARIGRASSESIPAAAARGRILAQDIAADRDSPAFDYSAMDGFAARAADAGGEDLPVCGESRIGNPPPHLPESRAAIRVATGSAIPPGADCVIRREDVREITDGRTTRIAFEAARPRPGDHIRRRAENARSGDILLDRGTAITAPALGVLASVGVIEVHLFRRVRVALITTGDELVPPDHPPGPFALRNSNAPALTAALASRAWIEMRTIRHARDDAPTVAGALRAALEDADAVVLTGGVSMGHRDPVRDAVNDAGAAIIFHGLPQRPGKPMLGAVTPSGRAVFGLPGNPVSALVTCTRLVLPALSAFAGATSVAPAPRVPLANPDGKALDLWWHRLVRLNAAGEAELIDGRGSGDLIAAGRSGGFIEVPPRSPATAQSLFHHYPWPS